MYSKHESLLKEFKLCIDEKRYYDAHEAIEELWFTRRFEECNELKLLKGFINAAVSFELIKRKRVKPSHKVSSPFLNEYHAISRDIEKLKYSNAI